MATDRRPIADREDYWLTNQVGQIVGAGVNNSSSPSNFATYAIDAQGNVTGLVGTNGVIGMVDAGAFGASPSASAAVNTAAIQKALDTGGNVSLMQNGVFTINSALLIGDNTFFTLGKNTTIRMAAATAGNMLLNKQALAAANAVTVAAWTAGNQITVTWNSHGLITGDFVSLEGATASAGLGAYVGVFRVQSVTNANVFVLTLNETPTITIAGIITAKKCNVNLGVRGGIWDGNGPNRTITAGWADNSIIIYNAASFSLSDMAHTNTLYQAINLSAVRDYFVSNIEYQNGDTTHISSLFNVNGPALNGTVINVAGQCLDDVLGVSLGGSVLYAAAGINKGGPIIGLKMSGLSATSQGAHGLVFYLTQLNIAGWTMNNIEIENISVATTTTNTSPAIAFLSESGSSYTNLVGNIRLKNICGSVTANTDYLLLIDGPTRITNLTLDGISITSGYDVTHDPILLSGWIDNFIVNNSYFANGQNVIGVSGFINIATFNSCTFKNNRGLVGMLGLGVNILNSNYCNYLGTANNCGAFYPSGVSVLKVGNFIGNTFDANSYCGVMVYSMGNPRFNFIGNKFDNTASTVFYITAGTLTAYFEGNEFLNASAYGLINIGNTSTVTIQSGGNNNFVTAGKWFNVAAGTPTVTLIGADINVDVGLVANYVAVTKGSMAYHSSAVAGRNGATQQGPAIANGTNWYALATGAAGVNTLIV